MRHSNALVIPNVLWVFLSCSFLLWTHTSNAATDNSTNILVLHSYNKGYIWTDKIDEGIESALRKSIKHPIFFTEYMDVKRISDSTYLKKYYELFRHKYSGKKIDIIITSDDAAYELMLKHGDELFPGIPVIFCGVNKFTEADFQKLMRNIHPNITGVVEDVDIKKTVDIALQFHPAARHVYVINDTSDVGKALHDQIMRFIPALLGRVDFVFLEDMGIQEISERVQSLPRDSIVLLRSESSVFFLF
ncbi:MAG: hypothetical protein HQL08_11630 [Nitrospirae bacterium]|nr:hypothetical protein [Nitrospirota bacterium]